MQAERVQPERFHCPQANLFMLTQLRMRLHAGTQTSFHCPQANLFMLTYARAHPTEPLPAVSIALRQISSC